MSSYQPSTPCRGIRLALAFLIFFAAAALTAQDHPYGIPVKKQPAWKGWELHAAASTSIPDYDYWTVSRSYSLASANNSDIRFIRDNGSVLYANYPDVGSGRNPDEPYVNDKLYQLGINRLTNWGGSFRLSLGYYRTRFRLRNESFTDLQATEVRTYTDAKERSLFSEVGFQYNFFRRGRFRPYVGINATAHLYYNGFIDERFIVGATGETGLVSKFSSKEYFPIYPDFSLTVGFQYQFTDRLSAGAFVWANNGYDLLIDAPLGIEMRYSLRDRPLRARRHKER